MSRPVRRPGPRSLVLASASPRRADLLRAAGYAFVVQPADVDESLRAGESPEVYVRRLAGSKAAAVSARPGQTGPTSEEQVVLGADTAVVLEGQLLGKPETDADAAVMLARLAGRTHEVWTGIALRRGETVLAAADRTLVTFAPLDADEIAWYVASGEPRDKAGAYGVQGLASRFVERIEGSYATVVGLPVHLVRRLLRELVPDD